MYIGGRQMLKYALIGCGRISINHIKAAINNKLEIIAVCDIIPEHMKQVLEKSGINPNKNIKCYTNYKEMIKENNIDLISIATESGKHAEIALYCIQNKIHVIIEKPVAMSIQDADEIIYQAEKNNVKVCACHQNRFNIAIQNTRKALENGRFGRISHGTVHVRWNRDYRYYKQALWRGTWEQDGGALMNQCIHGIDLLRWMLGDEIEEVYGVTRRQFHNYIEAEDFGTAIVTFKNGSVGIIEGTTNVYPENMEESLYLFGEKGTVKIGGKSANNIDIWDFSDESKDDAVIKELREITNNVYGNGHSRLFSDMVLAIEEDRIPYIDGYAGKRALELVLAVYKSQKDKVPVKLPLVNFGTKDMSGIF